MTKSTKIAVAYMRVSTERQAKTGNGFELQETAIRKMAHLEGYEIVEIYHDIHTGMGEHSFRQRPGAIAAVESAHTNHCPIIVDTLDRFSRNVEGLKKIIDGGKIRIIPAQGGVGLSSTSIESAMARAQRAGELISAKTSKALQERKARGVLLGNRKNLPEARAKGLAQVQKRVQTRARELSPVIEDLQQAGKTKDREIAEGLNAHGYRTHHGKLWDANNVRRLLKQVAAISGSLQIEVEAEPAPTEKASHPYRDHPLWGAF